MLKYINEIWARFDANHQYLEANNLNTDVLKQTIDAFRSVIIGMWPGMSWDERREYVCLILVACRSTVGFELDIGYESESE